MKASEIKAGKWFLVMIRGGTLKSTVFRYVARATADMDNDGEVIFTMQGYRSVDASKTLFKIADQDIFSVAFEDIMCRLQEPTDEVGGTGHKAHVRFCGSVNAKEI